MIKTRSNEYVKILHHHTFCHMTTVANQKRWPAPLSWYLLSPTHIDGSWGRVTADASSLSGIGSAEYTALSLCFFWIDFNSDFSCSNFCSFLLKFTVSYWFQLDMQYSVLAGGFPRSSFPVAWYGYYKFSSVFWLLLKSIFELCAFDILEVP